MLFTEKETLEPCDPAFSPQVSRQYECAYMTRKVLRLKSVVLTVKDEKDAGQVEDDDDESDEEGSDADGKMTVVKTEVGVKVFDWKRFLIVFRLFMRISRSRERVRQFELGFFERKCFTVIIISYSKVVKVLKNIQNE